MLFNSYIFIFAFFPLCLLGFYLLKRCNQTAAEIWLTGFSLWFYGYFNYSYLLIMLFSILFNYVIYQRMMYYKDEKKGFGAALKFNKEKCILMLGIVVNLLVLFYFKYYDFFVLNLNAVFNTSYVLRNVLLPLGISFFTFQQISFLTDAYRGEIKTCKFVDYALFVSFFPQLIAGPIVTHEEMLPQFQQIGKKVTEETFVRGLFLFVLGMCKKVLIADTFGLAVDTGYGMIASLNSVDAILIMLFYTLQLYYDFSGYCDMAIGIGGMMGIQIPLNFNSPYKASNIIDFWKRWHITLSRFFTKNIYIPLGGNRKGQLRMYVNLFLIFFLSGLWHGAGWNFILWGVMHGVLYCITRYVQMHRECKKNVLGIVITFLYVNVAWVFFRSATITEAMHLFRRMFIGGFSLPNVTIAECFNLDEFWYILKILHLTDWVYGKYILMLVFTLVIFITTFFSKNVHEIVKNCKFTWVSATVCAFLFVWCVVSLSGVSTFLYFNF